MPRKRRKRPNWPYRLVCLAFALATAAFFAGQVIRSADGFGNRAYGVDWPLVVLSACLDTMVAVWFFVVGSVIGSFLNVVAYRLPLGRGIGGHSGCPYCATPIDSIDNIPILGWLKLRGRCRVCRLPISPQYPLVEALVGTAFVFVFATELLRGGSNLPESVRSAGGSLMQVHISLQLVLRLVSYLVLVSGLIGAALIAVKHHRVPLRLFAWSILPWVAACSLWPPVVIVPWRREAVLDGTASGRIDAVMSLIAGAAALLVYSRLIAPVVYLGFDRRLIDSHPATHGARQLLGASAVTGVLLGWQSGVAFCWTLIGVGMAGAVALRRWRSQLRLADLTVWMWLALLLFRSQWRWWDSLQLLPESVPEVMRHVIGAVALLPAAWIFRVWAAPPPIAALPNESTAG